METNWDLLIENHFDKKETLAKFDTAKLSLEVDTSSISDDDIKENFTGVCVELVNVKMTLDSGKRRNFF